MSSEVKVAPGSAGSGLTVTALRANVRADLDRFVAVTRSAPIRTLYEPYREIWCPPLDDTLRATLAPENPIYEHTDWSLFVASRGTVDVGRVAAFWNPLSTLVANDKLGFFGFFEAADVEVARMLLFEGVWPWLKRHGASGMVGNISPTTNDEVGVLIEGFHQHILLLAFNPPEYPRFFAELGFGKEHDILGFTAPFRPETFQPVVGRRHSYDDMDRFADVMARRAGVTIETLDKRHADRFAREFCSVYNRAWRDHWGFEPYTSAELLYTARDLLGLIPKDLVQLARNKAGEMVGVVICTPDLNDIFRSFDGKMGIREMAKTAAAIFAPPGFPLVKRSKTIRYIALGVLPEYESKGTSAALMMKIASYGLRRGYTHLNISWVLEDNEPMLSVPKKLHLSPDQRWRFFSWRPT
mgnify:CR=1 FL=1